MGNRLQRQQQQPFPVEDWPWIWAIENPEYLDWKLSYGGGEGRVAAIQARAKAQAELPLLISSVSTTQEDTTTIYLSDARRAHQIDVLMAYGITHVLNVAGTAGQKKVDLDAYQKAGIVNQTIHGEDEEGYPMMGKHWNECMNFIQSAPPGSRIVVHCVSGLNRSGLLVAAYKLQKERCNVLDAVAHLRHQRGNLALNNKSFIAQLVAFARTQNLLGPKPGEEGCRVLKMAPPFHHSYYLTHTTNQKSIKDLF